LAATLTNQNSIHEEIMRRLKSGNACMQWRIFCLTVCYSKI